MDQDKEYLEEVKKCMKEAYKQKTCSTKKKKRSRIIIGTTGGVILLAIIVLCSIRGSNLTGSILTLLEIGQIPEQEIYTPSVLPAGAVKIEEKLEYKRVSTYYKCKNKRFVITQIEPKNIEKIELETYISTEIKVKIRGNNAVLGSSDEGGYLLWTEQCYLFTIDGEIEKDNIMLIANGMKPKKHHP